MRKQVFQACGHKLLIRPDQVAGAEKLHNKEEDMEVVSEGGIVLSTGDQAETDIKTNQNKIDIGTIVSLGPDCWKAFGKDFEGKPWAKVNDKIYYARFGGTIVNNPIDGEDYILLSDEDVNIVVETEIEEIS